MIHDEKLVIGCKHILEAANKGKKIRAIEVLEETFVCAKCAKKEPKTKKEFMDMFVSMCKDCIISVCIFD